MKSFLKVLPVLTLLSITGFGQKRSLDSLIRVANTIHNDTEKVNTLLKISKLLVNTNPDSSIRVCKEALSISKKGEWTRGIINSEFYLGIRYEIKGILDTGLIYEDSALVESKRTNVFFRLGSIYNEMGTLYCESYNGDSCIECYFRSLAMDSIYSPSIMPMVYDNLGLAYEGREEYLNAEKYYLKSLKIREDKHDQRGTASILANLSILNYDEGNYSKGLELCLRALRIDSTINNSSEIITDCFNTGLGYSYLHNYSSSITYLLRGIYTGYDLGLMLNLQQGVSGTGIDFFDFYSADSSKKDFEYIVKNKKVRIPYTALLDSSLKYNKQCISMPEESANYFSKVASTRCIGDVYNSKHDNKLATLYYLKAYRLADSLGILKSKAGLAEVLGHMYEKTGDNKKALQYLNYSIALKDSEQIRKKSKEIAEIEAKYQNEKKQKEIQSLAQENRIQSLQIKQSKYFIIGIISFMVLLASIVLLIMRQNRANAYRARTELQQKLLRLQMNPHFIFNAMTGIQSYIYKNDPQQASNYLSAVFKLMRFILESSREEFVSLEKEISALDYYLSLQQLYYNNKFKFNIEVAPELDTENIKIPPMIAQPFIENAIEHGVANKSDDNGFISIKLKKEDDMLALEIEDNGVGRDKAAVMKELKADKHLSVATVITRQRIELLNKDLKEKIFMNTVDLKNDKNDAIGTKVILRFPMNELSYN